VWTGVAVVAAGTAVAYFLRAGKWVRVVAVLLLGLSLANGLYIEQQLSNKRAELYGNRKAWLTISRRRDVRVGWTSPVT
jgi:hypothetical protein